MHFTTLGYSRPDGQTSDHWSDVGKLAWDPEFYRYVRDAFAPVGLMVDFWGDSARSGTPARVRVVSINDLEGPWTGPVTLRLRRAGKGPLAFGERRDVRLGPFGSATSEFDLSWPREPGSYVLEAELSGADGKPVRSVRELSIIP
jgi:hypothetical protein